MPKNTYHGKFIVFEGIDGSGKSTQLKLLKNRLKKEGYGIMTIDFPQYGQKSAGLVEEYLNGIYGSSTEVGPYRASIFYACDRYDASFKIKKWLKEGKSVIADRYFGSNVAHQGGKIADKKKRQKFLKWLYELEFGIFQIPKPDFTFILKISPEISQGLSGHITDKQKLAKKKIYLGSRKQDIHEKDVNHLINTEKVYLETAKQYPKDFKIIDCLEGGKLLSPTLIHEKVFENIKKIINKKLV
jgi:dTMP kinase